MVDLQLGKCIFFYLNNSKIFFFTKISKRARYDDDDVMSPEKLTKWSLNNEILPHAVFNQEVGRLDCDPDDISTDDDTIFNGNDPRAIDVSCASMTPHTRDKQVKFHVTYENQ